MATLKKRRGKWYARVLWYSNQVKKEKQIPLRTQSKVTARERLAEVQRKKDEVIELYHRGENYDFPWMNDDGILKVEYLTFEKAINKWLTLRRSQGIAESTISRNRYSMNTMMGIWGKNIRLNDITLKSIDTYTNTMAARKYKPNGININLRALRTFLNWACRREYITKVPYIEMVKVDRSLPSYISDRDFAEIMKLDCLDDHFRSAFQFYRDTGCRLAEPFVGELKGTVIVIPAKYSKSRNEKEIELDMDQIPILLELQKRFQSWKNRVKKPRLKYFKDKYSKEFKKCCKQVGVNRRFHDLRHTFAVRRYLQTKDIYRVMKEMGHSKVTTTQIYTEFKMSRLKDDFPNLMKSDQKQIKFVKVDTNMVDTKRVYSW